MIRRLPILLSGFLLSGCMTSALREVRHEYALPGNEIDRKTRTMTGHRIADSEYDIWRFQGGLIQKDRPRSFDLYLPKNRTHHKASIREVTSGDTPAFTGDTTTASFDLRYTSRMMLDDPQYRKNTPIVIGDSIANKGKCLSVGLREGGRTYHWYASLDLEWVKRDKLAHTINNDLYLLTLPLDAAGTLAKWKARSDIERKTDPLRQ